MRRRIWFVVAGALAPTVLAPPAIPQEARHGEQWYGSVLFDELEYRLQDGRDAFAWDGQAWYGGDYNKVWLETEGEQLRSDELEQAEVQLLYSRLLAYFWDLQAGVRYDFRPDPSRGYGVVGLQGLAPGFFELDLKGFVSDEGELSARLKAEYDLRITQRLILQPKLEVDLAAENVRERGIGRGISTIEPGLRLRYEITRKFAPYVGVNWERALGETADLAREEGEDVSNLALVAGVRLWF
jgi:copper resistance protein B